jgi:uncharacterized Tic20 family protein
MNSETQQEDRLMATLCHVSVLMPLVGVAVPLSIWLSEKERSQLLRFQAFQALIYQGLGLLAYLGLTICQFAGGFGVFPLMVIPLTILENSPEEAAIAGIVMMIIMVLFMLIMSLLNLLICILGPLFFIIAVWGGWRVVSGHDFYYPIIGRLVEKRMAA